MIDEKKVTDPRTELGADIVNLNFWQAAGISKVAPLVTFTYLDGLATSMLSVAWATLQYGFQDINLSPAGPFPLASSPWIDSVAFLGDGRVEIQFVDQVPDLAGTNVDLNFIGGSAQPQGNATPRGSAVVSAGSGGNINLVTIGAMTGVGTFDASVPMLVTLW
jgi:hypothetical protein